MFQEPLSRIHRAVSSRYDWHVVPPPASEGMGRQRSRDSRSRSYAVEYAVHVGRLLHTISGRCAKSSCISGVGEDIQERDVWRESDCNLVLHVGAMESIGQVSNSVPGNTDNPCSSDAFIRMKRTKSTLPASMEMLGLRGG
ncbi:Hypothetical protein PHPALM_15398 [Phytophthora palmivora]|uniref:Uncharacterized protein n=1 Tax=Phytophthora palmivora TaxID=4796 RepID=A0A2P4XSA8_9STRA|nr:Hypothetical protein PHPALM_15398 [Phytophthora palmivora]